jgi:hypothetical protein
MSPSCRGAFLFLSIKLNKAKVPIRSLLPQRTPLRIQQFFFKKNHPFTQAVGTTFRFFYHKESENKCCYDNRTGTKEETQQDL